MIGRGKWLLGGLAVIAAVYLNNASWLAPAPDGSPQLLAHRGVHSLFSRERLTGETCTAAQSLAPISPLIENTLPSMKAAFQAGADIVELDVHPTTDGHFAVFHDWTLDCRTDGTGVTREHDLATLQSLDLGYGYTVDGETFPLRGKAVGMMPSLAQVMEAFPDRGFLIDFKSNDPDDGTALAAAVATNPDWRDRIWGVYGGTGPSMALTAALPNLRAATRPALKSCLTRYAALGWSGHVPRDCRNAILMVPSNYGPWLWGWPDRFVARMEAAGSVVILRGPYRNGFASGIDTADQARAHVGFPGIIWTNDIRTVAPILRD